MRCVFFNELSANSTCTDKEMHDLVKTYVEVIKHCIALGYQKVRYEHNFDNIEVSIDSKNLQEYCNKYYNSPELRDKINWILTTQCHPCIDSGTHQEDEFIKNDYQINLGTECTVGYGMTSAFLFNEFAVGFSSAKVWKSCCFTITCMDEDGKLSKTDNVYCISELQHFENDAFAEWYAINHNLSYIKRSQAPFCHLREDHGIDELRNFSRRILKEDFIEGILNSLPFKPNARQFIESFGDNGVINLRLTWTNQGLGLAVKTVGKCKLQYYYFAKILEEKYKT